MEGGRGEKKRQEYERERGADEEGKERKNKIYSLNKLKTVYIFSQRVTFNQSTGGMLAFAWFVFDKEYNDDATLKFI